MITELQKRFEADAYKQKMNYAGSAGIAAEQGFLAGIDFLQHLLQQTQCTTQLLPVARIYSFAKWIASEDFDWHYVESDDLWKKDGWCSRTTAELLELYSRQ